jgi:hypothetical protein
MTRKHRFAAVVASAGALIALIVGVCARQAVGQSATSQAYALGDLLAQIVDCTLHPCLGDAEEATRKLLRGQILEDDCSEFSDITVAYPSAAGKLQGIAQFDLDGELDNIYLLLTDFHAHPAVVLAELERVLPGCECEMGSDEGDPPAWTCSFEAPDEDSFEIEFAVAPGLAYVDIY